MKCRPWDTDHVGNLGYWPSHRAKLDHFQDQYPFVYFLVYFNVFHDLKEKIPSQNGTEKILFHWKIKLSKNDLCWHGPQKSSCQLPSDGWDCRNFGIVCRVPRITWRKFGKDCRLMEHYDGNLEHSVGFLRRTADYLDGSVGNLGFERSLDAKREKSGHKLTH